MSKHFLAASIGLLLVGSVSAAGLSTNPDAIRTNHEHPAPFGNFALTQSGVLTVTAGNSVSCNAGAANSFNHAENSYYRRFNLDGNFAATGTVTIASVDIGIEQATGTGGTQPITVNLYAIPNAATLTIANLGTAIATANVAVADQVGTLLNVPIAGALDALTSDLVVEVLTPDGQVTQNTFFIGSNATASINPAGAPSYIRAPTCSLTEPATTASINFPNMNIVMVVNATTLPVSLQNFSVD